MSQTETSTLQPVSDLTFEAAIEELETVVRTLEDGRAGLEDAISVFERGVELRRHCEEKLRAARLRIDKLTLSPDGEPSVTPADAGELLGLSDQDKAE